MRKQWFSAAAVLATLLSGPVRAQTLDLGEGASPSADASTATGELAAFLIAQADEIDARPEPTDPLRASSAVRRLAAALLRAEGLSGDGSAPRILIARTIVAHLEALDEAIASGILPPARCALLAGDCTRLAADLPDHQHELDRALRDAFAPLTNAMEVSSSAWYTPEPDAANTTSLASLAAEPPERFAALAELDLLFIRARAWPSHRASADRAIALVRAASAALTAPVWLDADVRTILADLFDTAIADLRDPARADNALIVLDRLDSAADFIGAVDAIEPSSVRRRARQRANPLLAGLAQEPERADRTCRAATRIFRQASDTRVLSGEPYLPTFARVAWRAAEAELEDANARLIDAMLEQLDAPDPMTEPAMLAAILARREPRRLLEDISRIGVFFTGIAPDPGEDHPHRPRILADRRLLGSRVLALGKEMGDTDTRDRAAAQLADIAALVRASEPLDHEQHLRSLETGDEPGSPALRTATNDHPERLFAALDELHRQAADQLRMKDPVAPDASAGEVIERATRLGVLLAAIDAGRTVAAIGRERLGPWAAWELTDHAWAALLEETPARLGEATSAVLVGGAVNEEDFAVVRLCAYFARRLPESTEAGEPASALSQIALGVPQSNALGVEDREPLAAICRDLEECVSARLRDESDRADTLDARAARSALRVLEIIEDRGG